MQRIADGRSGEHAGRNVSERRAGLEKLNAEADPAETGGRPLPLENTSDGSSGSAGVMATACMQGDVTQHGKPAAMEGSAFNRRPARDRPGRGGWRRGS